MPQLWRTRTDSVKNKYPITICIEALHWPVCEASIKSPPGFDYILIRKLYWKPRPGRWKFDSSKMIGNHWWPQSWAVRVSWPMRGLRVSRSDQSEARLSWEESSCWTVCPGRYFLLAAQTFKPKVIPVCQTWPASEFRMTWSEICFLILWSWNSIFSWPVTNEVWK